MLLFMLPTQLEKPSIRYKQVAGLQAENDQQNGLQVFWNLQVKMKCACASVTLGFSYALIL